MRTSILALIGILGAGSALAGEVPVDVGPNTPEASKAFMGGGVILQGQPGAPAPKPQALAPAQTPPTTVTSTKTN
jgi:hypothetical protein